MESFIKMANYFLSFLLIVGLTPIFSKITSSGNNLSPVFLSSPPPYSIPAASSASYNTSAVSLAEIVVSIFMPTGTGVKNQRSVKTGNTVHPAVVRTFQMSRPNCSGSWLCDGHQTTKRLLRARFSPFFRACITCGTAVQQSDASVSSAPGVPTVHVRHSLRVLAVARLPARFYRHAHWH